MSYLISAPEKPDWHWEAATLHQSLLQQWPTAAMREYTAPQMHSPHWKLPGEHGTIDVSLHRTGDALSIDGHYQDCAQFALWIRSQVPPRRRLWYYDQGFNFHVELTQETQVRDVITAEGITAD